VEHPGVEGSGEKVVRRRNSVNVSSEMEVELQRGYQSVSQMLDSLRRIERATTYLGHGDNLRVSSTGGSTLDAEGRALRRLPDAGKGGLAKVSTELMRQKHKMSVSGAV
jgi:hypothetical protein